MKLRNILRGFLFLSLVCFLASCNKSPNQNWEEPKDQNVDITLLNQQPSSTPQLPFDEEPHPLSISETGLSPSNGSKMVWMDQSSFVYFEDSVSNSETTNQNESFTQGQEVFSGFWIQSEMVSYQQYSRCISDGKCSNPDNTLKNVFGIEDLVTENEPITGITWFQAQNYCLYIGARLPTNAEWEIASQAKNIDAFQNQLLEWVNDRPDADVTQISSETTINDFSKGDQRVIRVIGNQELSSLNPSTAQADLGFRCVLSSDLFHVAYAPSCYLAPKSSHLANQPTSTPCPNPPVMISASCQPSGTIPEISITIDLGEDAMDRIHSITANDYTLDCEVAYTISGKTEYHCSSISLLQGQKVAVDYCFDRKLRPIEKFCSPGYQINQKSGLCELLNSSLPSSPCPTGYTELSPSTCIPLPDEENEMCPIGYFSNSSSEIQVCFPVFDCVLTNSCQTFTCLLGEVFNAERGCCIPVDEIEKGCEPGYSFDALQKTCVNSEIYPYSCQSKELVLPVCHRPPTASPTSTQIIEPEAIPTSGPPSLLDCTKVWNPITSGWDFICP